VIDDEAAFTPKSPWITEFSPAFVTVALPPKEPKGAAPPKAGAVAQSDEFVVNVVSALFAKALPARSLAPVVTVAT
jgi:hypothetical protein